MNLDPDDFFTSAQPVRETINVQFEMSNQELYDAIGQCVHWLGRNDGKFHLSPDDRASIRSHLNKLLEIRDVRASMMRK